jgi:hypothetical protein
MSDDPDCDLSPGRQQMKAEFRCPREKCLDSHELRLVMQFYK